MLGLPLSALVAVRGGNNVSGSMVCTPVLFPNPRGNEMLPIIGRKILPNRDGSDSCRGIELGS